MKPNIYIVGTGAISRLHMKAASSLPNGVGEIHATDINADSLNLFSEEFPEVRCWNTIQEMLQHPVKENDIVIVATPPAFHDAPAKAALESGRNVLCEKPLGLNVEEIEHLVELAETSSLLFGCCSGRFSKFASELYIKRLLLEGAFGEPYAMTFQYKAQRARSGIEYQQGNYWFLQKKLSGGGVAMNWGVYDISYLMGLFEPDSVDILHCTMSTPNTDHGLPDDVVVDVEDHVRANLLLHWENKPTLPLYYERAICTHGQPCEIVELEGMKGAARWHWIPWNEGFKDYDFHFWWTKDVANKPETIEKIFSGDDVPDAHSRPLHGFVQRLEANNDAPGHYGRDALFNFKVLRGLYTAAETRVPIRLERVHTIRPGENTNTERAS